MSNAVQQAELGELWEAMVYRLSKSLGDDARRYLLVADGPAPQYDGDGYRVSIRFDDLQAQRAPGAGRWGTPCTVNAVVWVTTRTMLGRPGSDDEALNNRSLGLYAKWAPIIDALHEKMLYSDSDLTGVNGGHALVTQPLALNIAKAAQIKASEPTTGLAPLVFAIHFNLAVGQTDSAT